MVARPGLTSLCLAIALIAAAALGSGAAALGSDAAALVSDAAALVSDAAALSSDAAALSAGTAVSLEGGALAEGAEASHERALSAAERAHERAQRLANRRPADLKYSLVRTGIAAAGLLVFASGLLLRKPGRRGLRRLRLALLCALGISAFASYYQFFRLPAVELGGSDHFHYYVGSKYFDELGWFGLYECSLAALDEEGLLRPHQYDAQARDLRSMKLLPRGWVRAQGARCPGRFGEARWTEFKADVGYFAGHWPDHIFRAVWLDHGYHPTPIWSMIGAAIASRAPTSNATAMHWLPRIDRFLVAASLLLIAWAFSLEIACLAAIMWGTGQLWRYAWVGDGFLRQLWWLAAVAGLCLLRRGSPALGGAFLGAATGLRIFPAALPASYLLHAGRPLLARARIEPSAWRFALGATLCLVLMLALGAYAFGQGVETLTGFVTKMAHFASLASTNKVGLRIAAETLMGGAGPATRALELGVLALFLALFWRALGRCRDWEAAVLGVSAIPLLSQPTNYYFSFYVLALLLAQHRPWIASIPLLGGLALNVNGLLLFRDAAEFRGASFIAVALSFALVLAITRPTPADRR